MRVVQIGAGRMSVYTMRYVIERGGELVAAYCRNPGHIGKDISEIMHWGEKRNVVVQDIRDMARTLKDAHADIAIITTRSILSELEEVFTICGENGVNAVTIGEEAFFPWNSNPALTEKLDQIAKAHNCTFCGSGYQDVSWGSMIKALCATAASIKTIRGKSSYNLEDYGMATATVHGAGLDPDAFKKQIASVNNVDDAKAKELMQAGNFLPSFMWNVNGWLASALNLTVISQEQKALAQTWPTDLYSKTLGRTIPAGQATGMNAVVTTKTKEGITIETECIGKVFAPEEFDINQWSIEGEPNMTFVMERPATVEMTCACVVNRLPDVIAAPAGFVTSEKMPDLEYHGKF